MSKPTLTLCMIVKDEEHIIRECLESVYREIDRYDITDTGSTDRQKKSSKNLMRKAFPVKSMMNRGKVSVNQEQSH